jgi:AcrR family transcriptional regulator
MGLREKKRASTRKALILAAATLFRRQRYESVAVEDIAALANVAKGTLYNYFPSKEDLAAAVADAQFRQGLPEVERLFANGKSAIDIIGILFISGAQWVRQNPALARATLSHILRQSFDAPGTQRPVEGYDSLFALILRLVKNAQAGKQMRRDIPATELAETLAHLHAQTLWRATQKSGTRTLEKRMQRTFEMALDGMKFAH